MNEAQRNKCPSDDRISIDRLVMAFKHPLFLGGVAMLSMSLWLKSAPLGFAAGSCITAFWYRP